MSDPEAYFLSPRAIAKFTVPTPDLQRNYRARGMMDGIGRADESGRWKYSTLDLVGIWISDRLAAGEQWMDRRDALQFGRTAAVLVIRAFHAFRAGRCPLGPSANRYVVMFFDGTNPTHGRFFKSLTSLQEVSEVDFDWVRIVDLHRLAQTIPLEIQGLLIAEYETSLDGTAPDYAALMAEIEANEA